MLVDAYGYYDMAMVNNLLPLMKQYKVQAMLQGHRHVLDHVQESSANQSDDIHYFTIGAGALLEEQSWISDIIDRPRYESQVMTSVSGDSSQ